MNWEKEGRLDRFRYVRVSWPDMAEVSQLGGVTGATVTENSLSSLKASGTLSFSEGLDIGDDLVRIYSDSELDGERATVCHATLFATTPQSDWSGIARSGTADLYSVLWLLQQNRVVETFTAEAGANAVATAEALARENGLNVVATASDACVNTAHTWDAGTTHLEIVNWLLGFAGYASADVDAYGNVLMRPYVDPASKQPSATFSDTLDSVSAPGFSHELDAYEVPNRVTVVCSNAGSEPMVAHAVNDDPENPYSTVARGKSLVRVETVSDIADQAALQKKADELLRSSTSVVETVEVSHSYQPFSVGDAVYLDYVKAGYRKKLVSVSREMRMVPGIRCRTKARRYVNLLFKEAGTWTTRS